MIRSSIPHNRKRAWGRWGRTSKRLSLTTQSMMIIHFKYRIRKGVNIFMQIRPLHDRIIVKRLEEEERTKGGIIIPDTAKEKPIEGKVIAVGDGKTKEDGKKIPMEIKRGDRVLFAKYAGTEVKIDGEEHLMMREDDILAIIE
jgi:chaperonin GroES